MEIARNEIVTTPLLGPKLSDVKLEEMNEEEIRSIVEQYALIEDSLEEKLVSCRSELKEFSYVLLDVIKRRKIREAHEEEMEKERIRLLKEEKKRERHAAKLDAKKKRAEDDGISLTELSLDGTIETGSLLDGTSMDISKITGTGEDINDDNKSNMIDENTGLPLARKVKDLEPEKEIKVSDAEADEDLSPPPLHQKSLTSELTGNDINIPGDVDDTNEAIVMSDTNGNVNKDNDINDAVNSRDEGEILSGLNTNNPRRKPPIEAPAILKEKAEKLATFAMYCGFSNLRIDEAPFDTNMQY